MSHFSPAEGNMARLCRLVKLYDRFDTHVFTFQVPASVLRPNAPDVVSRDFMYAHQKWYISLVRSDTHVGVYLSVKNVYEGMRCELDYSFTLVHPEHFTRNDTFTERACSFTSERSTNGRQTFVGVRDLTERGFRLADNGEFMLELELRSGTTTFEQVVELPRESRGGHHPLPRVDTNYFTFGFFDWNLTLYPQGDDVIHASSSSSSRPVILLTRHTHFDHLCRLVYKLTLGHGERFLESDSIEHVVDISGHAPSYDVGYDIYSLTLNKCRLRLKLELSSVSTISQVEIWPFNRSRNRAHLYDRDKQAWMVESDVSQDTLTFRMYYMDVGNVPRKFLRHVTWSASLMAARGGGVACPLSQTPFSNYFSQTDYSEEAYEMPTTVPVKQLEDMDGNLLEEDGRLTVRIEWLDSHLLYKEKYTKTDELSSKHRHQMKREIMALQSENYALEKQLHHYQQSLSEGPRDDTTMLPNSNHVHR